MQKFDSAALEVEAGVRAVWLLYKRGAWGYLEDFGMEREKAEPVLRQFEQENLVSDRLTKAQCRRLLAIVPGLEEVGVEMRLAYALKFYEQGIPIEEGKYSEILSRRS